MLRTQWREISDTRAKCFHRSKQSGPVDQSEKTVLFWRGGLKDIVAKTTLLGESGSAAIDVVLLILKNVNLL